MDDKVRRELLDTIRCQVRKFCGINSEVSGRKSDDAKSLSQPVYMAFFVDRAFKNTTAVAEVVQGELVPGGDCQPWRIQLLRSGDSLSVLYKDCSRFGVCNMNLKSVEFQAG